MEVSVHAVHFLQASPGALDGMRRPAPCTGFLARYRTRPNSASLPAAFERLEKISLIISLSTTSIYPSASRIHRATLKLPSAGSMSVMLVDGPGRPSRLRGRVSLRAVPAGIGKAAAKWTTVAADEHGIASFAGSFTRGLTGPLGSGGLAPRAAHGRGSAQLRRIASGRGDRRCPMLDTRLHRVLPQRKHRRQQAPCGWLPRRPRWDPVPGQGVP